MCPDITLRSTFIVGFPGETEADFEDTLKLVEAVGYASAFSFKYSRRPGTPAAAMPAKLAKPASVAQADWDKMSDADKKKAVDKAMGDAKKAAAPAAPAAAAKPAKKGGC